METNNIGINYGTFQSNRDPDKGIRFGVILQDLILEKWADSVSEETFGDEPIGYYIDNAEYRAYQKREDPEIMITKSPYFTYAQFCSPCAPGAVYLTNWLPKSNPVENNRGYCFGHDWFEPETTGKWIDCGYCEGTGFRKKADIVNYNEARFIENRGKLFDDKRVWCWVCYENFAYGLQGKVKEYIRKAPYPIYSVKTGKIVEPEPE